jgi:hypothetical protein
LHGGVGHLVAYLPFTAMTIVAPLLRLAAWATRQREQDFPTRPSVPTKIVAPATIVVCGISRTQFTPNGPSTISNAKPKL